MEVTISKVVAMQFPYDREDIRLEGGNIALTGKGTARNIFA
jgi:agmatine/peptidylarginine deiminase